MGLELGVPAFSGHLELIKEVEAVSVVTPALSHHALARDVLSAGVHCLWKSP